MNSYKLKDLLSIKNGKDHKELNDGNIPVFGSGGIMRYGDKALFEDESILLPRKGTLSNIQYVNEPFWTVDTIYYSVVNKKLANPFYLFIRQYTTQPSRRAKAGDILLSVRAPVGTLNIADNDCCIGRGLAALNSKSGYDSYLYYVMEYFKQIFDNRNQKGLIPLFLF